MANRPGPQASNNALELPFGASLFDLKEASRPDDREISEIEATIYSIPDQTPLLRELLAGGRVAAAEILVSIEGYQVSPELIERVRSGQWNPADPADRGRPGAMAARGYWLAF